MPLDIYEGSIPGLGDDTAEPTAPAPLDFEVRTFGGPTWINFEWQSLIDAFQHIQAAADLYTDMRTELTGIYGEFDASLIGHLHWRIPGFHVRVGALIGGIRAKEFLLQQSVSGVESAHQGYRGAEARILRIWQMLLRGGELDSVVENFIHPQGDRSYAYDWMVTMGVLGGGEAINLFFSKYPQIATIASTVAAIENDFGFTGDLMRSNHQVIDPDPAHTFTHDADGSLSGYFDHMTEAADHGDISVSKATSEFHDPVYMVHLPGVEFDGVNLEHGRSPASVIDAFTNDSEHMTQAVSDAMEAAEVPEGAIVHLTGFSMGGMHAANIAKNKDFGSKYNIRTVTTIGSPLKNEQIETGTKVTHFEDARDPVVHLTGDRPQLSSDRILIELNHQDPENPVQNISGSAHDWEHNIEGIRQMEEHEEDWLDIQEVNHLDEFRIFYQGEVETYVFDSSWETNPGAGDDKTLEDFSSLDHLQEALRDGALNLNRNSYVTNTE